MGRLGVRTDGPRSWPYHNTLCQGVWILAFTLEPLWDQVSLVSRLGLQRATEAPLSLSNRAWVDI